MTQIDFSRTPSFILTPIIPKISNSILLTVYNISYNVNSEN